MEPIRKTADGAPTAETEEASDTNDDPSDLEQSTDLPRVCAVSDKLQNSMAVPGRIPAGDTEAGTKVLDGRGVRAVCAELLDSEGEAM
jgi:hypothetical protein